MGREGGVSRGALSSLNLARRPRERDEDLAENWRRVTAWLRVPPDRVALVTQVHGARVLRVTEPAGPLVALGEADALVTDVPGVVLAIRTADCVPVLLASSHGVAAAHAGWRGTAAGVVGASVGALRELGDSEIVAAVGPSIAGAHYEVGDEVVAGLAKAGGDPAEFVVGQSSRGRPLVDVAAVVVAQLRALGVRHVDRFRGSTFTHEHLWSHRRHGAHAGRQAAVIVRGSAS